MGVFKSLFGSQFNYPSDIQDIRVTKAEDLIDWLIDPVSTRGGFPKNNPVIQSEVKVNIKGKIYTVKSASIKDGIITLGAE